MQLIVPRKSVMNFLELRKFGGDFLKPNLRSGKIYCVGNSSHRERCGGKLNAEDLCIALGERSGPTLFPAWVKEAAK